MNVAQYLERHAAQTPDLVAIRFEGRSISYGQLNSDANRLASSLRAAGVATADRCSAAPLPVRQAMAIVSNRMNRDVVNREVVEKTGRKNRDERMIGLQDAVWRGVYDAQARSFGSIMSADERPEVHLVGRYDWLRGGGQGVRQRTGRCGREPDLGAHDARFRSVRIPGRDHLAKRHAVARVQPTD